MNEKTFNAECVFLLGTKFFEHPFMVMILKEFGYKGSVVVLAVLSMIAENGGELRYSQKMTQAVARMFKDISRNLVVMVIRRMVNYDLLDRKTYDKRRMLTPPAQYLLGDVSEYNSEKSDSSTPYYIVSSEKTVVSSEKIGVNSEETVVNSEEIGVYTSLHGNNLIK